MDRSLLKRMVETVRDLIARASPSVVRVYAPAEGQAWVPNGTAFAVSDSGVFATADHVLAPFPRHAILFGDRQLAATVVARSSRLDLALLRIQAPTAPLSLGTVDEVQVGDEVLWGGFPFSSWLPSWHRGMVSYVGEVRPGHAAKGIQVDGTVNRGNSGGPIINPKTGAVIGIVTSALGGLSEALADDLAKLRIVGNPSGPRAGIELRVGGVSADPFQALVKTIEHLERSMQLGVGYGISAQYLSPLLLDITQDPQGASTSC